MNKIKLFIVSLVILMLGTSGVDALGHLNTLITASSEETEHSANLASDGDYNSYWQASDVSNQSLLLDLEEVKEINSVVQIFNNEDTQRSRRMLQC